MTHITYQEIMKPEIKLSFIIPIYNVENYLRACVESILPHIDNRCEIILVDDGATDSSPAICDEYKERSDQVVVIHKPNGGLASARNAGLEICKGEYVAFVDSDDRIHSESIATVLKWIESGGADLCFMQAEKFYPGGKAVDLGDCISEAGIKGKTKGEVLKYIASRPKFPGSSCTKIYRRSFLKDNDLHFPYENIQSEDLGFVRDCVMKAESYDAIDAPYYEYRQQRMGSITDKGSKRSVEGLLIFIEDTISLYSERKKAIAPYGKYALSFGAYEYGVLVYNCALTNTVRSDLINRVRDCKWITNYSVSLKQNIVKYIVSALGISRGGKVLAFIYKARNRKRVSG